MSSQKIIYATLCFLLFIYGSNVMAQKPVLISIQNADVASGSGLSEDPVVSGATILTITDEDPSPSISINGATVVEGNSGFPIRSFTLATVSGKPISVMLTSALDGDSDQRLQFELHDSKYLCGCYTQ